MKLLILKDKKNDYTCCQVPIDEAHKELVEKIRSYIIENSVKFGYEGFSVDIDKYYDPFSDYFFVENKNGKILATSRITKRTDKNLIPFEKGLKLNGTSYRLNEEVTVGDMNSFAFGSYKALNLIYAIAGRFAEKMGMKKGFCLLDEENERIKKVYLNSGWKYSNKYSEKIYYPTFGKTKDGKFVPTLWTIMEIDFENINKHSKSAGNFEWIQQ